MTLPSFPRTMHPRSPPARTEPGSAVETAQTTSRTKRGWPPFGETRVSAHRPAFLGHLNRLARSHTAQRTPDSVEGRTGVILRAACIHQRRKARRRRGCRPRRIARIDRVAKQRRKPALPEEQKVLGWAARMGGGECSLTRLFWLQARVPHTPETSPTDSGYITTHIDRRQ